MKKLFLSVLALLAFAAIGTAQTLPSYVPANGLVGWWPFNGNANDESGNNNNGTVNGAILSNDRFGHSEKSYYFDGILDFIKINSTNASLQLNGDFSFSIWAKLEFNGASQHLLVKGDNTTNEFSLNCREDSTLHFDRQGLQTLSNFPYSEYYNKWTNIVCVMENSSGKLYVNGDFISTTTLNFPITASSLPLIFGTFYDNTTQQPNPAYSTKGYLDDISIYNRALTQQEITGLYQGANTTANCPTFPTSLAQGLVGYWPFCGNALDESGNNNHGTVNGATLTTDRFGNAGSAYNFQNSYISLPTSLQNNFGNPGNFTFSCWFKNNDSVFIQPSSIVGGRNSNGTNYTGLHPWPGTKLIRWYVNQATTNLAESNSANLKFENITVWNHIVGTFTGGTTPKLQLFYNGVLVDTASFQVPLAWIQTNQFNLGFDAFYPRYYTGSLDDIAIWNRALSQQEITQLYNQGICQTSITVTDTLLIHTGITSYNPIAYGNTVKVWPNPGNTAITLDAGNLSSMQGWKYKVANTLGQTVVNETAINQQQTNISLSNWGGNGIYYLHLINPQGHAIEIKKIVLAP
jgi:hypothetical protein